MKTSHGLLLLIFTSLSNGHGTELIAQSPAGEPRSSGAPELGDPCGPLQPKPKSPNPGLPPQLSPPIPVPPEPGTPGRLIPQPNPRFPTVPGEPTPGLPQRRDPLSGLPEVPSRSDGLESTDQPEMVITEEHIKKAQNALRAKGLTPGKDGILDDKTQQALQDFQKANGLPATGVLDDKTAARLGIDLPQRK